MLIGAEKSIDNVVLTVEGTDVWITEKVKPELFRPFRLVFVKRMAEAIGGTVTFESKVGKGIKIAISLPLNQIIRRSDYLKYAFR